MGRIPEGVSAVAVRNIGSKIEAEMNGVVASSDVDLIACVVGAGELQQAPVETGIGGIGIEGVESPIVNRVDARRHRAGEGNIFNAGEGGSAEIGGAGADGSEDTGWAIDGALAEKIRTEVY